MEPYNVKYSTLYRKCLSNRKFYVLEGHKQNKPRYSRRHISINKKKKKKKTRKNHQKKRIINNNKNTIKVLFIFFLTKSTLYRYRPTFISEMQSQCRNGKRPNIKTQQQKLTLLKIKRHEKKTHTHILPFVFACTYALDKCAFAKLISIPYHLHNTNCFILI